MLDDEEWVDGYLEAMRSRLGAACRAASRALGEIGVPHTPASAGFFVFADLRAFLPEPTWKGEDAVWRRILDDAGVNVTPGAACRAPEPGFVRICFAAESAERAVEAIGRIGRVLGDR
jgi:aspartate/methionine/tyrosine aminotransferase